MAASEEEVEGWGMMGLDNHRSHFPDYDTEVQAQPFNTLHYYHCLATAPAPSSQLPAPTTEHCNRPPCHIRRRRLIDIKIALQQRYALDQMRSYLCSKHDSLTSCCKNPISFEIKRVCSREWSLALNEG